MKGTIYICPICGQDILAMFSDGYTLCLNCDREVIPLATPQVWEEEERAWKRVELDERLTGDGVSVSTLAATIFCEPSKTESLLLTLA